MYLELLQHVDGKWPHFWNWEQPDLWLTGQFHTETYRTLHAGVYHVYFSPRAALGTGGHSCTVQVYEVAP